MENTDEKPLEAKDVIERLCKLQGEVFTFLDNGPADCFCGKAGLWGQASSDGIYDGTYEHGYRNYGYCLEFIEKAVREKIALQSSQEPSQPENKRIFFFGDSEPMPPSQPERTAEEIQELAKVSADEHFNMKHEGDWYAHYYGFIYGYQAAQFKGSEQ